MSAYSAPERVLTFALGGEMFAIDAQCVREILEVPSITRVPGAMGFANGLINVRGAIVPLADLAVAFGMAGAEHGEDTRVIVIEAEVGGEPSTIGILADKVHDVAAMEGMSIEDAPTVGMRWRADVIRGITRRNGQFVILPDLDLILADSLAQAAKVSAAA
jgi:purine-binding chemotaxis protein CheW